jgi:hypothetical protein
MFTSSERERTIGRWTWLIAWAALVLGQIHALARHATADGKADLDLPLTRLWAVPAAKALRPLLDWAAPDTVYLTYGKIWLPVFLAFTVCAFIVHRRRRPAGFEKWAWRIALTGYVWACIAVFVEYWTNWTGYNALFEPSFLALAVPGMLLTLLGSTALGIGLLRNRFRPRVPGLLLALTIPIALSTLQLTSQGSAILPVAFAFAILGRDFASADTQAIIPVPVAGPVVG